jgi:aryl-alcohol dehydrogenase-like predicted oxidoreductase
MRRLAWQKRRLGRTGFCVTPLGLGGAHLGRTPEGFNDQAAVDTVLCALKSGINLVDTAPMYGESQRRVGMALEQWCGQGGRREDLVLSTKTGRDPEGRRDYSADGTRRSVEESLRLLRTDYLDILLVHDPDEAAPVFGKGGALEALRGLKDQKVIRAIGVGVRSHDFIRLCIESGEFDVVLTFWDYNLINQSAVEGVLEPAAAHDVGVLNGAAVMLGLLGGRDPREFKQCAETARALELWQWARSVGADLLALNLQFCLQEPRIASTLVGARSAAEIQADIEAVFTHIPAETWQALRSRWGIP